MTNGLLGRTLHAALTAALLAVGLNAGAADLVSERVTITGAVKSSLTLGVDDLKAFPTDQLADVNVTRRVGDKEVSSTLHGVKLGAALERAGLVSSNAND